MKTVPGQFDVLLYHDIDIIVGNEKQTFAHIEDAAAVPRAAERARAVGAMAITVGRSDVLVEMHEVTYEAAQNLPLYVPGHDYVVSRQTIAGALRAGRPVDDLLYPYKPVRDPVTNIVKGVEGLACVVPVPRQHKVAAYAPLSEGLVRVDSSELVSTCDYDTKIFASDADARVPAETKPLHTIPRIPMSEAVLLQHDVQLDEVRTEKYGVPVFETRFIGLQNDWTEGYDQAQADDIWRVCHIDTPFATANPSAQHVIVRDIVRDENNYMLGGKSFARLAPEHFTEPLI